MTFKICENDQKLHLIFKKAKNWHWNDKNNKNKLILNEQNWTLIDAQSSGKASEDFYLL